MRESLNRMQPFWEQAAIAQRIVSQAVAPLRQSMDAIRSITAPISESLAAIQRITEIVKPLAILPSSFGRYSYIHQPFFYPEEIPDKIIDKPICEAVEVKNLKTSKSLVKLPIVISWETDIELRFKDPHTLSVLHKDKLLGSYSFIELGFDRKNTRETERKPDKQWGLLHQISIIVETGYIFNTTPGELAMHLKISKAACYKLKASLSKKLQLAFGIPDDPFQEYNPEIGYRLKFTVRPEPLLRGDGELHASGGKLFGKALEGEDQRDDDSKDL